MGQTLVLFAGLALVVACGRGSDRDTTGPTMSEVTKDSPRQDTGSSDEQVTLESHRRRNLRVRLRGRDEVPPRDTPAEGKAFLHLRRNGTALDFELVVHDIENVVAAHVHVGAPGVNGSIVAFLFGPVAARWGPTRGRDRAGHDSGRKSHRSLAGHPLSDLLAEMRAGNAYVNVHTDDGVSPANASPGDFPGGEIRGQL